MPSIARRRTSATLSACRRAENVASSSLGVPVSKAALRTVTSKWSMSMTCMGAWLGVRRLTYGGRHTHPKQKERQRASPPTLYREAASKRIASRAEGWAAAQPLLRSASHLGECSSQAMCAVHSSLAFAVPCHAEAARVPSIALCSFFRKSIALLV